MPSIDQYLSEHQSAHLEELKELLRIPSISTAVKHKPDVDRAAGYVAKKLTDAGCTARIFPTTGHPVVYGEWLGAPGQPTLLIYGHYDVQPVEPLAEWRNPPFEPTIENGNIVARGATDDKGQMYCHIKAIEAHMKTAGKLPVNVKVLIEGEEEIGSPSLNGFLETHREMLAADAVVISDTSMYGPGAPAIMWGLRGLAYFEIHVTGPSHDLHSGLYGGGVGNPINALAEIIASLKDADGRISIPGFYDNVRPISDAERAEIAALAHDDAAFLKEVGIAEAPGEAGYSILERITARPTLDCNGIWGGYTDPGAKTVLPREAFAKFSCRLVPFQTPEEIEAKVKAHIAAHVPPGITAEVEIHHGAMPVLVSRDAAAVRAAQRAFKRVWSKDPVFVRGGGSIPVVAAFKSILGIDSVLMGFGLTDDRLHSPNEKFGLENYFQGIRAAAYMLEEAAVSDK